MIILVVIGLIILFCIYMFVITLKGCGEKYIVMKDITVVLIGTICGNIMGSPYG